MSEPSPGPSLKDLYDTDFYAWTRAQAASLRQQVGLPAQILGAERLADEIEEMGRERRRAVESLLREVMAIRLMLACTSFPAYRPAWSQELARQEHDLRARATPSLIREFEDKLAELYASAAELAARRLIARDDDLAPARLPLRSPWTVAELTGEPPTPQGS